MYYTLVIGELIRLTSRYYNRCLMAIIYEITDVEVKMLDKKAVVHIGVRD